MEGPGSQLEVDEVQRRRVPTFLLTCSKPTLREEQRDDLGYNTPVPLIPSQAASLTGKREWEWTL